MDAEILVGRIVKSLLEFCRQRVGVQEEPTASGTRGGAVGAGHSPTTVPDVDAVRHAAHAHLFEEVRRHLEERQIDGPLQVLVQRPDDPAAIRAVHAGILRILAEDESFGPAAQRQLEAIDREAAVPGDSDETAQALSSVAMGNRIRVGDMKGSQFALGSIVNNKRFRISLGFGVPVLLVLLLIWWVTRPSSGSDAGAFDAAARSDETERPSGQGPATTRGTPSTTTTTLQGIPPGSVPLVTCDTSDPTAFTATVSAMASNTGDQSTVLTGVPSMCNSNGELTNTTITTSGRYVVTIWPDLGFNEPSFNVLDLATGDQVIVTDSELDAWATAQTGTGLNAAEGSLAISGFDRNADGTIYFLGGEDGDDAIPNRALAYFSLDLGQLMESAGDLSITRLPDERWCYGSMQWSVGGGHCLAENATIVPSTTGPERSPDSYTTPSTYDHSVGFYAGCDAIWMDATTVIAVECGGKTLYRTIIGQESETLYQITGDRYMTATVDRARGVIYLVSPTLDRSSSEVFTFSGEPGTEPEIVSSVPGRISVILS